MAALRFERTPLGRARSQRRSCSRHSSKSSRSSTSSPHHSSDRMCSGWLRSSGSGRCSAALRDNVHVVSSWTPQGGQDCAAPTDPSTTPAKSDVVRHGHTIECSHHASVFEGACFAEDEGLPVDMPSSALDTSLCEGDLIADDDGVPVDVPSSLLAFQSPTQFFDAHKDTPKDALPLRVLEGPFPNPTCAVLQEGMPFDVPSSAVFHEELILSTQRCLQQLTRVPHGFGGNIASQVRRDRHKHGLGSHSRRGRSPGDGGKRVRSRSARRSFPTPLDDSRHGERERQIICDQRFRGQNELHAIPWVYGDQRCRTIALPR